jgi:hypothetical protein
MTSQEQEIVEAIWGDNFTPEELAEAKRITVAIQDMAALLRERVAAGKMAYIPPSSELH